MPRKVLLVEFHKFHAFVLLPQYLALQSLGYEVTILLNEQNPDYDSLVQLGLDVSPFSCDLNMLCTLKTTLRLARSPYEFIVFNTLPWPVRQKIAVLLLPKQIRFIMHYVGLRDRFKNDWRQRLLEALLARRASRLYYLSDQVLYSAQNMLPSLRRKMRVFYLSRYPEFEPSPNGRLLSNERINFAILGEVNKDRRNYEALVAAMPSLAASPLRDRVRIQIMGDVKRFYGPVLVEKARECGLLGTTIVTQETPYIPMAPYFRQLAQTHFILSLIDPTVAEPYNTRTASSSSMIGRGLCVPFVHSDTFPVDEDLRAFTVWFPGDDVMTGIERAVALVDSSEYAAMRERFRQQSQEQFEQSIQNYR